MSTLPQELCHYAVGPAFHSMMDLSPAARQALLDRGAVHLSARYADSTYIESRARVEAALRRGFIAKGGRPTRHHPHYALLGRSAQSERNPAAGLCAHLIRWAELPPAQASFTLGDSFHLDPAFRAARGLDLPGVGEPFPLEDLHQVLAQYVGVPHHRPIWMEVEVQLWFDPAAYRTVRVGPPSQ